ncbi:hypothetical protein CARUB_v10021426mg, partial [Capsella rubella]
YIMETTTYPREHELLKELQEATIQRYGNFEMGVPVDESQFLSMLVNIINAKNTIEIGVFTGYSLFTVALALPEDGRITAIDIDQAGYNLGLKYMKIGLDQLLLNGEKQEYEFAFVDADKTNYIYFHEKLLKLVKVGRIIAFDNTLWFGTLIQKEDEVPGHMRAYREALLEFNKILAQDPRVEVAQIPIGDGLTLCRRII